MDSTSTLMLAVLFGAIGLGLFVYGKKRKRMVCPYLIPNLYILALAGVVMTALPFVVKR